MSLAEKMDSIREGFENHLAATTPFPIALDIVRASGVYLYDRAGNAYMDMISGVAVSNLGHGQEKINAAIKSQIDKHLHVMVYGEFIQTPAVEMAQALCDLLPACLQQVYPVNSGTEANEAALKLAKRITSRTEIISFRGAYHGSTHGSLSVSGNETKKYAFRPLLPDVRFLDFNDIDALEAISNKTAAVIIELIQGDAGVRIAGKDFVLKLREICRKTGAQLIVDEIQTGFGRTGKMFAFEHYNICPDILTLGKALGGGLPIGAMISAPEKMRLFTENPMLGHITTFGGNPIPAVAAKAFIDLLKAENVVKDVEAKGEFLENGLQHPLVKEIRRKGLMFAIEMGSFEVVKKVVDHCLANGLIGFWFISCNSAFRLAPPLNITEQELTKAINIIQNAFNKIAHEN